MISWTELHTFIFVVLIKLCVISMRRCVCVCTQNSLYGQDFAHFKYFN